MHEDYVTVLGLKIKRGSKLRVTLKVYRTTITEEGVLESATSALIVLRKEDGRYVAIRISEIMILEYQKL